MNALIPVQNGHIGGRPGQTVNARDLHEFLGVGRDFSNWMKDQIEKARLVENRDYMVFAEKGENSGRPRLEYHLTIDAAKHIGMMSGTDKGFEIRDYFIECERRAHNPMAFMSRADLLRLALEQEEKAEAIAQEKALAERQRDQAIATKAQIGLKREATAMNTASQAAKKAAALEIELDQSMEYATVKRMERAYERKFDWRKLKAAAEEMGIALVKVPDANYFEVNAYHADVWRKAFGVEIPGKSPRRRSGPRKSPKKVA